MDYPIKPVRGNWLKLAQPLEKIVWLNSQHTIEDYVPAEGDNFKVTLVGAYDHYEMEKVQIELNPENNKRNLLTYENNGTLPLGLYDIEISVTLADGKRLHSCQPKRVKVVKTNSEASIPDSVEFGVDTYELDCAVFMYVPSEGGGGEDGVGIDSITTVESPDDGGNNVVTIRLTDGTQSSFNVKNGHKGSDGAQGQPGTNGHDGANGATPEIRDGYWYINNTPTGVKAVGEDGHDGNDGRDGSNGADGIGISSITVTENPNDGGNNVVTINLTAGNPVSFNVKNGSKGSTGNPGTDGVTPHIDSTTGNWFIGNTDTLVHAQGPQGPAGTSPTLNYDNVPTNNSSNLLTSGTVFTALQGKEDKVAIITPTLNNNAFDATVGNYYKVTGNASAIDITLVTPSDTSHLSNCIFLIDNSNGIGVSFHTQNLPFYQAAHFAIATGKVYEVNALFNGTAWYLTQVEMEVQP